MIYLAALSEDGYEAWVAGADPVTGEPRGRVRSDPNAVRFVEVVVNGPKSWSLAAELHADVAAAYEAAQDRAAARIVAWLGQHASTRVGPRGGQVAVPVQRLEAAVIRHYTSRAGDPHRHLHLQVNARVFAAGAWRGLDTVAFRDSVQAVNGIGHATVMCDPGFRMALAGHGYTLTRGGEFEQLAPYVGSFSKRAAQIGALIDRYETTWRTEHPGVEPGPGLRRSWDARAWAQDRPDKIVPRDGGELRGRWLAELGELGYRDRDRPMRLSLPLPASVGRDAAAGLVLTRLGAARSAWNAADVRGEVELLLAGDGVIAEPGVREELAEDVTARALARCVRLRGERDTPAHIRALTSTRVLAVEAELVASMAARGALPVTRHDTATLLGLDPGQRAAVAVLAGDAPLVVIEGAAGAGKTTTLAAVRMLLEAQGRRLLVVTPTLKAAQAASVEIGVRAGSAAWLAWQHGWRWDQDGAWENHPCLPAPQAVLRAGDLLLIDEAGMADQDTTRALVAVADQTGARLALVGDRRQLPAVGRGGVLDVAHRWVHLQARVDLSQVHRFVRVIDGITSVDERYAALTIAMRDGADPGSVFDELHATGRVTIHPSETDRADTLAGQVADARLAGASPAVVVDTREQAGLLNTAIRQRLVAAGAVDDTRVAVTDAGQRVGAGDLVVTRRNDPHLGVANRESWTLTAVHRDGAVSISDPQRGRRDLPAAYVRAHLELGYAVTGYGAQGDTTDTAHLVLTDRTSAAAAYVAMTRGRTANTAHLVADSLDDAREQWISAFGRDRADLGPAHAAARADREATGYTPARPLTAVLADLHAAWDEQADTHRDHEQATALRERLQPVVAIRAERDQALVPLQTRYQQARADTDHAQRAVAHSVRGIEAHTAALCDRLLTDWDTQRETARDAARTVHAGPGRLGLRLHAVNRATDTLAVWATTWQPYLPDMPTRSDDIAHYAGWPDNRGRLLTALDRYARTQAEHAAPHHGGLIRAVEAAQLRQQQAGQELADTRARFDARLERLGPVAYHRDPEQSLDTLCQHIADTGEHLAALDVRIAALAAEPAVTSEPPGWLGAQHTAWQHERDQQRAAEQHARAATARRILSPPTPTRRHLDWQPTVQRQHGPGIGR